MSTTVQEEPDLSERDREALALIERNDGIHQSEFWKEMDVSSRTGSRIINKLREKGLVEREKAVYEERTTYYVTLVHDAADLDFSLLMASDKISPFVGNDEEMDEHSDRFSQWVMELTYED